MAVMGSDSVRDRKRSSRRKEPAHHDDGEGDPLIKSQAGDYVGPINPDAFDPETAREVANEIDSH